MKRIAKRSLLFLAASFLIAGLGCGDDGSSSDEAGSAGGSASSGGSDDKPTANVPNNVYTGGPECTGKAALVEGTVEGMPVQFRVDGHGSLGKTYYDESPFNNDDHKDGQTIELGWSGDLTSGKPLPVKSGTLVLPKKLGGEFYCITAGQAGISTVKGKEGFVLHYKITQVTKDIDFGSCVGAKIDVDLRGCSTYTMPLSHLGLISQPRP